jgi:hypothetical protein
MRAMSGYPSQASCEEVTCAVIVNEYGGTPVVAEVPTPQPGPGQVPIRLPAAGMNPMDRSIARGAWQSKMPGTFPMVLPATARNMVRQIPVSCRLAAGGWLLLLDQGKKRADPAQLERTVR